MFKNKIIALLSVVTMMFSFATVANAEKTALITDPTYFIDDLGYMDELGYAYAVGISYDEYGTTNPFTFVRTGANALTYKYSGIGFAMANIKLEGFKMTDDTMVANATMDGTYDLNKNGLLNFTLSGNDLVVPDTTGALTDKGAVFFVIISQEEVDLADVTCSDVTLYIKDFGTTAAKNPSIVNEWTYSSDPAMVAGGKADFLAYTKATGGEDEKPVTGSTGACGKPEAGNAMVNPKTGDEENTVVTSFNNVELTAPSFVVKNGDVTQTFDASHFPTNVKGAASIIAIIRYASNAVTSNVFEMELFNGETSLGTATYVAE